MAGSQVPPQPPAAEGTLSPEQAAWLRLRGGLRDVRVRPEVELEETAGPQRLAPFSAALTADVLVDGEEAATGRLVLLHDPAGHEAWQGTTRLVAYVRAELELEMAADPLLPRVGWAWLEEALEANGARAANLSGTVTRVTSEGFGAMAERATAQLELRASWTPADIDLGHTLRTGPDSSSPDHPLHAHVSAFAQLCASSAGLPPLPPGVALLGSRR
ncbi:DUF3000 domain-containing protein [Motilibacter deserti]|uniref:DUF3000 domain-containing protein n=1 Tax=Motilibacter deserti TaxID=2714956 RepID=A0ABX0GXC4_9ACTN|nr:DUF3000 domain-containing protein [Motilibacter deserti]NHC13893.1 DUF3000 domain-containing protein [Motilibacter deserti]